MADLLDDADAILSRQQPAAGGSPLRTGVDDSPGQFQTGLRSGVYGAGSQLRSLAGGVGEALGFDEFAQGQYDAARELQGKAQEFAPRVSSYEQVLDSPDLSTGIRNAWDYATGLIGQSVPVTGAALAGAALGGPTLAGRMIGGTLATAPMETGDVIQRQQNDPVSLRDVDAVERLAQAAGTGLVSAGTQAVVPGLVMGKIAGPTAKAAASKTVGQIVRGGVADAGLEGITEGAGEAVKQAGTMLSNPEREFDTAAIIENAVGGAVAGGTLGAAGVAGELAHKAAATPTNVLSRVKEAGASAADAVGAAGRRLLGGGAAAAGAADAETGAEIDADPAERIQAVREGAKADASAFIDNIINGEPVADIKRVAGKTVDQIKAMMPELDAERVATVKGWFDELKDRAMPPERAAQLQQAAQDLTNPANQKIVAAAKKGMEVTKKVGALGKSLWTEFNDKRLAKAEEVMAGTKHSDDFSGVRENIRQFILPVLQKTHPGLEDDPQALRDAAEGVRIALDVYKRGGAQAVKSGQIARLIDLFGPEAVNVMHQTAKAMGMTDGPESTKFFDALNEFRRQKGDTDKTLGFMARSMAPELQETVKMPELRAELEELRRWARTPNKDSARGRFFHDGVRAKLAERYGENADKLLEMVEKEATGSAKQNVLDRDHTTTDEDGEEVDNSLLRNLDDEQVADRIAAANSLEKGEVKARSIDYGPENHDGLSLHPRSDPKRKQGQAYQAWERARKENPDRSVAFIPAKLLGENHPRVQAQMKAIMADIAENEGVEDPKDLERRAREEVFAKDGNRARYGIIAADGEPTPGTIDKGNVAKVMAKEEEGSTSSARYKHPSVFRANGKAFDAIAITREMNRQFADDWTTEDEKSAKHRIGRMFMAGLGALQDHLGKPVFPDGADGKSTIPDDLPIYIRRMNRKTGKPEYITFGEVKNLDYSPGKDPFDEVGSLRLQWAELRDKRNELMEAMQARVDGGKGTTRGMRMKLADIERSMKAKEAKARTLIAGQEDYADIEKQLSEMFDMDGGADGGFEFDKSRVKTPHGRDSGDADIEVSSVGNTLQYLKDRNATEPKGRKTTEFSGATERDPFGNIHKLGRQVEPINTDGGDKRRSDALDRSGAYPGKDHPKGINTRVEYLPALRARFEKLIAEPPSAAAKAIAQRGLDLLANSTVLNDSAKEALLRISRERKLTQDAISTINGLHAKYAKRFEAQTETKAEPAEFTTDEVDNFAHGTMPDGLTSRERVDAFLVAAAKRLVDLTNRSDALSEDDDITRVFLRAQFSENAAAQSDLGMMYDEVSEGRRDDDEARAMVKQAVPEVAALFPKDGGRRFSLLSTQIHSDLGRSGFAATHDSPIKHEGRFDWRKHEGKGEGFASFGMGTYLSTAQGVHEAYKEKFTAMAQSQGAQGRAPTYEVSVDIAPTQLMGWDAMTSEQSKFVQAAIKGVALKYRVAHTNMTGAEFYRELTHALGSKRAASDALQAAGILGHKYAATGGTNSAEPNYVIYDDSKITTNYVHMSKQRAANKHSIGPTRRKMVEQYIDDVLGPTVDVLFAQINHAGDFTPGVRKDIVRISVHALNPMSVAYHESLHGFFKKLAVQGNKDVVDVLKKAALSEHVQKQLRELLKGEPHALRQIADPEEAAAYMYQFWATKDASGNRMLQIGPAPATIFGKIAAMIRKVLDLWTNDERAVHIMEYFHSGEFKRTGLGQPSAVTIATMDVHRNKVIDKARELTAPVLRMADTLASAGSQRLRATGIPALRELADQMKPQIGRETSDPGFLAAARAERTRYLNRLGEHLRGYEPAHMAEALKAMQTNTTPASAEAKRLRAIIQGKNGLAQMLQYMEDAGVDVQSLTPRRDYFPRVYDASYISRNAMAFRTVLENNGLTAAESKAVADRIIASEGAEFTVETDRPGAQFLKMRTLGMIPDAQLEPFMKKDLVEILSGYITQATRRAEWARRFGDDGKGVTKLLDKARRQGATKEQLETAEKFVMAVDGTLGDDLNPTARRLMGNVLVYQNLRLLPLAIFSSVVDPLGVIVRGGTVRDGFATFKRGIKELRHAWAKDYPADADTKLAEMVGTIDSAMMAHTMSGLYMQGMVGDTARKINDTFFRFNLMESFNRSMRVGATQAAIKFLERHADGTASVHSKRWMRELGFEPGEYDGDLTNDKVRAAINRWVDGAVLRPDAADKPIWMSDPRWMLIAHLKQFIYGFQETILKRVMHEYKHGNYAPAMVLTSYVPMMIASDALKGALVNGGDVPEWKRGWGAADYVGEGVQRAGLLGVGQFAVDGPLMMAGPTAQHVLRIGEALDGKAGAGSTLLKSLPANALFAS